MKMLSKLVVCCSYLALVAVLHNCSINKSHDDGEENNKTATPGLPNPPLPPKPEQPEKTPPTFAPGPVADAVAAIEAEIAALGKAPALPSHVVGLSNCGNTCFINAVLQVLLHTPYLQRYFSQDTLKLKDNDPAARDITNAFHELFHQYRKTPKGKVVDTSGFIAVKDIHFAWKLTPGDQGDAVEFFRTMAEQFHTASNVMAKKTIKELTDEQNADLITCRDKNIHANGYSFFSRLFGMYTKTSVDCGESKVFKHEYVEVLPISLPTAGGNMLSLLTEDEEWQASEFKCSTGNLAKQQKTELHFLQETPAYAVMQLLRFSYDKASGMIAKNSAPVDFPMQFKHAGKTLELYGVVMHHGSFGGGHYNAYVRDSAGSWFYCNDDTVSPSTETEVLGSGQKAYVLFYEIR
jgi:uncharacterized UBP type Zn finger protein